MFVCIRLLIPRSFIINIFALLLFCVAASRFTLWKRFRPVAASGYTDTHDFGAIQMSVTYAVDYVEEGWVC